MVGQLHASAGRGGVLIRALRRRSIWYNADANAAKAKRAAQERAAEEEAKQRAAEAAAKRTAEESAQRQPHSAARASN